MQLAAQRSGSVSGEDTARAAEEGADAALQEASAGRKSAFQAKIAAQVTDNAIGNFTKPQRISVRLKISDSKLGSEKLGRGMSVEAYVDTASPD